MAKGHRSQIKRERNANKDTRPSAKLSYARVSVQKAIMLSGKSVLFSTVSGHDRSAGLLSMHHRCMS